MAEARARPPRAGAAPLSCWQHHGVPEDGLIGNEGRAEVPFTAAPPGGPLFASGEREERRTSLRAGLRRR